jgi:hypothetical protein
MAIRLDYDHANRRGNYGIGESFGAVLIHETVCSVRDCTGTDRASGVWCHPLLVVNYHMKIIEILPIQGIRSVLFTSRWSASSPRLLVPNPPFSRQTNKLRYRMCPKKDSTFARSAT